MTNPKYIYDIDDHPPPKQALLYGLQWAIIMFPGLIIIATLSGKALHMGAEEEIRFFQLILLTSGFFTAVQSLWGHRYPVLEGPATALLLTFIILAPYGLAVIQGGMILGGVLLICVVTVGKFEKIVAVTTPNVVGVILMLIAFSLLPYLGRSMTGVDDSHPHGEFGIFLCSVAIVILTATLSHWLRGFWKTISLLLGIILGSLVFFLVKPTGWWSLQTAPWFSMPSHLVPSFPRFYWPAVAAFASSYVAVFVNSLGSIQGIANVTDRKRLHSGLTRGILFNGVAGICCGLLGVIGTVSYSMSPGVVLANRVASRYATVYCGLILLLAALMPKLAALFTLVPAPVVGATLFVAMGAQVGAALSIISSAGMSGRDYFVVGLPVLLGTLVSFLPEAFMASVPGALRVFLGNGLIVGIFMVLLLEHVLLRKRKDD